MSTQSINPTTLPKEFARLTEEEMDAIIQKAKETFGQKLLILAHHYQKDEVVAYADEIGDSLQLAQIAEKNKVAETIVFCGVHFMAETADMLTSEHQKVLLPNLRAGCSMADMADIEQLEIAWDELTEIFDEELLPVTYINSTAEVKSFVGSHGGVCVTSGNAENIITWALAQGKKIFFLPDQHLGRNTSIHLGIKEEEIALWNPLTNDLMLEEVEKVQDTKVILWDGNCCVHQKFTGEQINTLRQTHPEIQIIVHPECPHEIVSVSDDSGSTNKIIKVIENAPKGSTWAIGTDNNLVNRLIQTHTDKEIYSLNASAAPCRFMNLITKAHLAWVLQNLLEGVVVNQLVVDEETTQFSKLALDKMLELS